MIQDVTADPRHVIAGAKVIYRVLTVEMKRFDMHAGAVPSYLSTDIISFR